MPSALAYILQVNILLAIVYLGYILLLKNLTFYQLNRGYFLSGVLFALAYPFLDIRSLFQQHIEPVGELIAFMPNLSLTEQQQGIYTLENLLYGIISLGLLWFAARLCIQLFSLLRIHFHSVEAAWKNYLYRNVLFPIVPFSFLNKIYVNKEQHQELELHDIFEHEGIHVKGLHSLDILCFEILLIVCWYSPFVWLMRRAVRQNLEFLTDQQVLNKGVDRQTYQYSLLHVSKQGASVAISNQFNFKLLKKRIMMMNRKRSSKIQLSNYAFLLPIIIFSAGAFTVTKADNHIIEMVNMAKETDVSELGQVVHTDASRLTDTVKVTDEKRLDTLNIVEFKAGSEDFSKIAGKVTDVSVFSDTIKSTTKTVIFRGSGATMKAPLFIVDGVKQGVLFNTNELNPNTIASIEVLKDVAAISTFGEEGKNGVVKIFTKKSEVPTIVNIKAIQADTSKNGKIQDVVVKGHVKGFKIESDNLILKGVNADGKQPLMIVDGVEKTEGLDNINPNDIESISILKDASAKAVYGDKGAHGVILVTTKVGVANKTKTVQGVPLTTRDKKDVVVVGYAAKRRNLDGDSFYNANDPESLKRFLENNRANIDLKSDVVLVINGKVAREADLKSIKAADVSQVGAIDLTEKNSNLPKNMVGLLFLKDGNPRVNRGASASVYNAKKKIELVVNPDKKDAPYIERK